LLKQTEILSKGAAQSAAAMPLATMAFHNLAPSRCIAKSLSWAQPEIAWIFSRG
jgi:hypothetical protein